MQIETVDSNRQERDWDEWEDKGEESGHNVVL